MVKIKKVKKQKLVDKEELNENPALPKVRASDEVIPKKTRWTNKQRVLVFGARGISYRDRHLMKDLKTLMPHHRTESKMERTKSLAIINEMCEMKHCNKAVLFEGRRKRDLYMWLSNVPEGPSVKFYLENIHTMGELKLTGNCLRGARPLLSFDDKFNDSPHLLLIKEMLTQTFGVPNYHPKSQPFYDHVYTFTYLDSRIWFRNYQILSEDGALAEIGPRFVMNPIKIFEKSFHGEAIWENFDYCSPAKHRQLLKKAAKDKYINKLDKKVTYEANRPKVSYKFNALGDVFQGETMQQAKEFSEKDQIEIKEKKAKKKEKKSETIGVTDVEIQRKVVKLQKIMKKQKPKRIKPKAKKIKDNKEE